MRPPLNEKPPAPPACGAPVLVPHTSSPAPLWRRRARLRPPPPEGRLRRFSSNPRRRRGRPLRGIAPTLSWSSRFFFFCGMHFLFFFFSFGILGQRSRTPPLSVAGGDRDIRTFRSHVCATSRPWRVRGSSSREAERGCNDVLTTERIVLIVTPRLSRRRGGGGA